MSLVVTPELIVVGIFHLPFRAHQLNLQLLVVVFSKTVYEVIAEPKLRCQLPKSCFVGVPILIEVNGSILPGLEHLE